MRTPGPPDTTLPDGLHVLVNNSGVSWAEPLDRTSGQRSNWGWDRVLDLNVKLVVSIV